MSENFITVTLLNTFIKNSLDSESLLDGVTVFGEVSGAKMSGAHLYFTLKDESASISCNSFNAIKTYVPRDGESVLITGKVDYYVKGGRLNFNCQRIQNVGTGLLAIRFEELKRKLFAEGLFRDETKKEIPAFCKKVGVITSKTGAVIKDIITTVRRYNRTIDLFIRDTRVQGLGAENELAQNLYFMDSQGYDAIIIARGGGSMLDLEPFNSEVLARAIYKAKIPIISAVGHETDYTICDMVADVRCATPTASGELIAYSERELLVYFQRISKNIYDRLLMQFTESKNLVVNYAGNIKNRMLTMLSDSKSKLALSTASVKYSAENMVMRSRNNIEKLMVEMSAKNPMTILERGLFKIKKEGEYITPKDIISVGDIMEIVSIKTNIKAVVKEIVSR